MGSLGQYMDPAAWMAAVSSGWSEMGQATFWVALLKIMWINILLSGDNAVVIAMACRGLPHRQRLWGMVLGAGVAVVLRILLTGIVATLMTLPYLKIVGGLALFYIAAKLLVPDDPDEDEVEAVEHLWRAVRIVAVADVFDALTQQRPYKPAWPVAEAIAEIDRQRSRQFDPDVVDAFLRITENPGDMGPGVSD